MKKVILLILAGILLIGSVSAVAEYKDYRLTEGDMSIDSIWGYLALDAHNTVVLNRTMTKGWHVTWYRDGKLYRDISGKGDITMVPAVVGRDGDTLFMAQKVAKDNTEVTYMKWTEEGQAYHLNHSRGKNSDFYSEEDAIRLRKELVKVCSMKKEELQDYITGKSWR